MSASRISTLRTLLATSHKAVGWVDFRLGRLDRARWHFERVLQLVGDDFAAYVNLGRVAYRLGDYAGWRRECGHARRTSPGRFAALRHPFELYQPRSAGAERHDTGTWRSVLFSSTAGSGEGPWRERPGHCGRGVVRHFGDDFSSELERSRFRELGPISASELRTVDLDELTERLVR